jgi:sugar lactone lactonase YvrE
VSPEPVASPVTQASARVTARIEVGAVPGSVALGDGSVWVTVNNFNPTETWAVVQVDPSSNEVVSEIPLPGASNIAFGNDSLWVSSWQGNESVILQVDPRSHGIVRTIDLGRGSIDDLLTANGELWATTSSPQGDVSGEVDRIEPSTGKITARIPLPASPRDMLFSDGSLWVYGPSKATQATWEAASVYRIDPAAGTLVDRRPSRSTRVSIPIMCMTRCSMSRTTPCGSSTIATRSRARTYRDTWF